MPSALSSDLLPSSKSTSVPPAAMPLISSTALLRAHLQQTPPTRPSTRSTDQPQQIDLNTSSLTHTNGSSVVKIGTTTIVCGIRAEILPVSDIPSYDPRLTTTQDNDSHTTSASSPESHTPISLYNLLVPNLELSTGCSTLHPANTAPSIQAQSISQRLYTLLLTTSLISSSTLTIKSTPPAESSIPTDPDDPAYVSQDPEVKAFWVLYIDMVCISYGGEASVFDAAWLAIYAALKDTLLPRAWWDVDEKMVLCDPDVERATRLSMQGCPVPIGFGVVVGEKGRKENWILVDPDAFEEQCCDEVGYVVVDCEGGKGRIVRVEKSGGGVVGVGELKELLGVAERRWSDWKGVLDRAMAGR